MGSNELCTTGFTTDSSAEDSCHNSRSLSSLFTSGSNVTSPMRHKLFIPCHDGMGC
ncbi:hypothetical protein RSAG8_09649, partial [Rhizoctonia solani AG-8 WAC10335]